MRKFKNVNELVNELKPDYPVYCIRPKSIKKSTKFFKDNFFELSYANHIVIKMPFTTGQNSIFFFT